MSKLTFKTLESIDELNAFVRGYEASFTNKKLKPLHSAPAEKLQEFSKVVGVFLEGRMLAGYVVNNPPVRSMALLPNSELKQFQEIYMDNEGENCEVSSVWCLKALPKNKLNTVWNRIAKDVMSFKPKRIFSSCYKGHGMFKIYNMVNPQIIYLAKNDGENHVFYYSKLQFYTLLYLASIPRRLKYAFSFLKDQRRRRLVRLAR